MFTEREISVLGPWFSCIPQIKAVYGVAVVRRTGCEDLIVYATDSTDCTDDEALGRFTQLQANLEGALGRAITRGVV